MTVVPSPPNPQHNTPPLPPSPAAAHTTRTPAGTRVIVGALLLGLSATTATGILFLTLGKMVDTIHAGQPITTPAILLSILLILIVSSLVGTILFLTQTSALKEEKSLRHRLTSHFLNLGTQNPTKERTGAVVSLLTDDTERITYYRQTFIGPMVGSILAPLITILLIGTSISWSIAGWLSLTIPLVPLLIGSFEAIFRKVSGKTVSARRTLSSSYLDALQGLTTLRTFRAARRFASDLAESGEKNRVSMMRLLLGNQLVIFMVDVVFSIIMIIFSAFLAFISLRDGTITLGQALAVVLFSTLMLEPLDRIGQFFYVGMGGMAAQRKAQAFFAEEPAYHLTPTHSDTHSATHPATHNDTTSLDTMPGQPGAIALNNVTFSHHANATTPLLNNITLTLSPGEHVGLVGSSGGGKSTLAGLILGDLVPNSGTVTVDGRTVGTVPAADIRRGTVAVHQTTWLFTGTLADNLRIAKPTATDDELWAALRTAALDEDIAGMPDGLNTQVGERGYALSGGQAQRVAIARAVLADAPIMVFDEPTSHVDIVSEAAILSSLRRAGAGKTVLTIAHRPTALRDVTRTVELAGGHLTTLPSSSEETAS